MTNETMADIESPEQIREEIERTRADLGEDVDALADKVRPSSIVGRQAGKVRSALSSMKESVKNTASGAGHAVAEAPRATARQAEAHPVAVGLIALGVGALAAALIPASQKERELARTAKDKAQPLTQEVTGAAKEVAGKLREPAKEAAESLKMSAKGAAESVKSEATTAKDEVAGSATQARENMASPS